MCLCRRPDYQPGYPGVELQDSSLNSMKTYTDRMAYLTLTWPVGQIPSVVLLYLDVSAIKRGYSTPVERAENWDTAMGLVLR